MSWNRLSSLTLAAAVAVVATSQPADALVAYDARTLGMGGNSVGFATNGSLVYWNPAAPANSKNFGLFLPTIGLSMSNNILGLGEAQQLTTLMSSLTSGGSAGASNSIFARLGSAEGLNLQAQMMVEPLGFSVGRVGPGSLALRLYGSANAVGSVKLSTDFATDLNALIFQKDAAGQVGFQQIVTAAQSITAGASQGGSGDTSQLKSNVSNLKTAIEKNMSSFLIGTGTKKAATKKEFSADVVTGVSSGVALTYAYPVQMPAAVTRLYPESQLTIGATGKVLGTPMGMVGGQALPGGAAGASFNPTAGTMAVSLDIDREVTNLMTAVVNYEKDGSLSNLGELLGATQDFIGSGLTKTSLKFSSLTPDTVGVGADIGAHFKFDRWWAVGLTAVNPLLFWNAKKTSYAYVFNPNDPTTPLKLQTLGTESVSYRAAEPFSMRLGAAFTPQLEGKGPPILVNDILLTAGLDAPLITGTNLPIRPSLHLGFEKLFGPIALRLGTQQLGFSPFYTAGTGIQTRWFQLNVGAGVDNPANIKGAAASANLGVGF